MNKPRIPSQREMIKDHLIAFGCIEPLTALREYGCYRLQARIGDLRHKEGMRIETQRVSATSKITGRAIRFAKYVYLDYGKSEEAVRLAANNN